jgi:hypothetical protein
MPTESGDAKLLGNFRKLIDHVSADPNYNPSNPALTKTGLESLCTAAQSAVSDIAARMAPHKVAVNERQTEFEALPGRVRRSRNMVKASGGDKKIQADLDTYARKVIGTRKSPKAKDDPNTPANEAGASHSASQMSFENQVGNFESFVAIVSNIATYKPNEDDLKVAALQASANALKARNNAVSTAFAPLSQARGTRDQELYLSGDCVVNTALLVKAYVSAAFGSQSQLYKSIKPLRFDRKRRI